MEVEVIYSQYGKEIEGPLIINPKIYYDKRGYFLESWNDLSFKKFTNNSVEFVQDNHSSSKKGVIRGMHYQLMPKGQGKLVRCTNGKILDVIIDLRTSSNTFGEYASIILNDIKMQQIWIPIGFAHGFLSLSDNSVLNYKATNFWDSRLERSIAWNDIDIDINWKLDEYKIKETILNDKDLNALTFKEAKKNGDIFE